MMRRPPDSASTNGGSSFTPFAAVDDRVQQSIDLWARDLRSLFEHARDRFGDVSWEAENSERIWAHKAVVYVRAPKAFKDRYFLSNKSLSRSPTSFSHHSPYPGSSLLSATSARNTPSPSYFRGSTLSVDTAESDGTLRAPTLSAGGDGVLHLGIDDSPELFLAQLEWLYTGEGFGDVVEWINKEEEEEKAGPTSLTNGGSVRDSLGRRGNLAQRRDKLGQDLTYMWTSKLYCDVRIHLESPEGEGYASDGSEDSDDSLASTVIFTAHRFMLVSRSPYFSSLLLNPTEFRPLSSTTDIYLPTPPFTPAALHFCLGWIYAGHLAFSNRSFDLLTAFQIYRSADYLQLDALTSEVESRLVYEFCHGLEWSKCHCRKCLSRIPRVWRFACAPDVAALEIQRRARRFILTGWAECWNREVGLADPSERDDLVSDVVTVLSPNNVIIAFRGIERVRARMEHGIRSKGRDASPWVDALEGMIEAVERRSREILTTQFTAVCESADLWDLVFGKGFNDDVFELILKEIVQLAGRPASFVHAPKMYQTIVSSILLKVHPETLETALPTRSVARQKIESAKDGVLTHIRRRWMQIKEEGGFAGLETWALKEISDEIEVPIDDLLARQVEFPGGSTASGPTSARAAGKAPARTPRTSESSRASTVRSPVDSTTSDHPNGLRRLRLSSSASTCSAMSTRSTATRPGSSARREHTTGPTARSPTAASKTPIVSVGAKGRASTSQARPFSPTPTRTGQVMTGPPRPLLTGKTTASKVASSSGTRHQTASPGPSTPVPAPLRHRQSTPVLNSRKSTPTLRHQTSMASVKSTSSVRTTGTARTSLSAKSTGTVATVKSGSAKVSTPSPRPGPSSRSVSNSSTATKTGSTSTTSTKAGSSSTASTKASTTAKPTVATRTTTTARPPVPKTPTASTTPKPTRPTPRPSADGLVTSKSTPTLRTRTLSAASAKSRAPVGLSLSPAPAMPAGASVTARSASVASKLITSRTPTARSPAAAAKTTPTGKTPEGKSPALRSSASSKSLSSRAAAAKTATPPTPKTPVPKPRTLLAPSTKTPTTPSSTLQTPPSGSGTRTRSTSLNPRATPPSASRQRTTSTAAPWKRATPLPPSVAGVRQPRKSIRSSSGSTEGPQEAITPRVSNAADHIIVVEDNPMLIVSPDSAEPDVKEDKVEQSQEETRVETEETRAETDGVAVSLEPNESAETDEPPTASTLSIEVPTPSTLSFEAPSPSTASIEVPTPSTASIEEAAVLQDDSASVDAVSLEDALEDAPNDTTDHAFEDAPEEPPVEASADTPVTDETVEEPAKVPEPAVQAPVDEPVEQVELSETSVDTPTEPPAEEAPPVPPPKDAPVSAPSHSAEAPAAAPVTPPASAPGTAAVTTPVRLVPAVIVPQDAISPSQFMDAPSTPTRNLPGPAVDLTPRGASTPPTSLYTGSPSVEVTPTNARAHQFIAPRPTLITARSEPTDLPIASQYIRPPLRTLSPPVTSRFTTVPVPPTTSAPGTPPARNAAVFGSPISIPIPAASPPLSVLNGSPRSVQSHTVGSPLSVAGSPIATVSRIVSEAGSTRSQTSPFRHHPARAFDPPPRKPPTPPPPTIEIEDEYVPYSGKGISLHVGIPCIVTLSQRRVRFRANVKYLGRLEDESDVWVGLEVDDLERFGVETLSTGAKGGVRYFHFTKSATATTDQDAKNKRQRRIAAIAESLPSSRRRFNGLGLAGPGLGLGGNGHGLAAPHDPRRAASPFVADWAPPEKPRALFVRPHEVVFVMGAE